MPLTKTDLIAAVAAHTGSTSKDVAAVLGGLEDVIVANVAKGEKVVITGAIRALPLERLTTTYCWNLARTEAVDANLVFHLGELVVETGGKVVRRQNDAVFALQPLRKRLGHLHVKPVL